MIKSYTKPDGTIMVEIEPGSAVNLISARKLGLIGADVSFAKQSTTVSTEGGVAGHTPMRQSDTATHPPSKQSDEAIEDARATARHWRL